MTHRILGLTLLLFVAGLHPSAAQSPEEWQQHVEYDMDITLHADAHQYTGAQTLVYTNNSPDTLDVVYYHLYFNAFRPTSMMAERNRHVPDPDGRIVPRIFTLDEDEQGWHRVRSLTQDGTPVDFDVTDTVMEVELAEPIPPGASTTFEMQWRAQIPLQTRRSGRDSRGGGVDFSMAQWYPKMAEYDERGWHADPYVMREFYAPYGTFDVQITLPTAYTVGASGLLQNADEVGHGYDQPGNVTWTPSDGVPEGDSLTWHFVAENVHDFAWAADPDYVHDKVEADGVTHHILYKPDVEEAWMPLKDDMPRLTRYFNQEFGPYPYPQMTVAQGGDGGMEYPMFTLVSGYDNPEFERKDGRLSILGTTVHEFAHMWYYAALGTNESDYAWMDEGFTSYATEKGMAYLTDGEARHSPLSIVRAQKMGLFEKFDTPADWYQTNLGYGVAAYSGGELLVAMLGYVIGDENRDRWLKRYLREREFQHPDPFDVELFAEQESGMKLDWYFWQTANSTRVLDDALEIESQTETPDGVRVELELERKGEAVMPHDVALTLEDGSTQMVHVPLMVTNGHKPVGDDWIVTEPWPWVYPEKTFVVTVPSKVDRAVLDPEGRTPDVNRLNNTAAFPVTTRFLKAPQEDWRTYEIGVRPLGLYADTFGFGGGVQARGTYFMGEHRTRAMLTIWPEVIADDGDPLAEAPLQEGSSPEVAWIDGIDFEVSYEAPLDAVGPRATGMLSTRKHLGVLENRLSLRTPLSGFFDDVQQTLRVSAIQQYNRGNRVYQGSPRELNPFGQTHLLSGEVEYRASSGPDFVSVTLEAGGSLQDGGVSTLFPRDATQLTSATHFELQAQESLSLGRTWMARANLQFGLGPSSLVRQKQFRLGSRSVEDQWRNDLFRQTSSAFVAPLDDAHVAAFNPAGPVGYLRREAPPNNVVPEEGIGGSLADGSAISGANVLAGRLSVHGQPFASVNALSPLGLEAFSGIGSVWSRGAFLAGFNADDLVADAGLGLSYDIASIPHLDRFTAQSDALQDLKVIARFPFYVSDPEVIAPGENEFEFRWLIGIELR